tara:strand:+ start:3961 stop:4266 length:306 start_codon:yes stop_codon:yes gene_type:complete
MYPECKQLIEETTEWVSYWDGYIVEDCESSNDRLKKSALEARTWAWQQYRKGNILIAYRNNELSNWKPQYVCKKREPRQNASLPRQNRFAEPLPRRFPPIN